MLSFKTYKPGRTVLGMSWLRVITALLLSSGFAATALFTNAYAVDIPISRLDTFLWFFYLPHYVLSMLAALAIPNREEHRAVAAAAGLLFSLPASLLYAWAIETLLRKTIRS